MLSTALASTVIRSVTTDGDPVEWVDKIIGSGAMKDVYFSPDKSYVVAFYKAKPDANTKERLLKIAGEKWDSIFQGEGGDYWKNLFCWPYAVVEHDGRIGIVAPSYQSHFFFTHGSKNGDFLGIKGCEKEGKWFASANNQNRFLDPRERGDWLSYLSINVQIARAVRRMHGAGLAHSDLSYKNVLVDPAGRRASVIDVDGLVVPGKYPPDVVGTPDFIAPEVVMTTHLKRDDPQRILPSIRTDRHALAVLIYMYLFYRHPLRGGKVHDITDELHDEALSMGAKALFVEHPTDAGNRIRVAHAKPSELPWADTAKLPYTVAGPYLAPLFKRAFIDALHHPEHRPTADEWESALVKTIDLIQPCHNPSCDQRWYVFDNTMRPVCPFCGTPHQGKLPVLNLYSSRKQGQFRPDNHRLMVWTNQSLFLWHINRLIAPNERLTAEQKQRVGYFVLHAGQWWLVNEKLPALTEAKTKTAVPIGGKVALTDGLQLLFGKADGDRLVVVQMVDGAPVSP